MAVTSRRCWRSTSSRKRSRTTATCSSWRSNLQQWQDKPRRASRHARQPPPGLRRAPAAGAREGSARWTSPAASSDATRWRPNWSASSATATPRPSPTRARARAAGAARPRARDARRRRPATPGLAQARERYRRAAGALLWQQSEQFAARLWSARKGMQELQRQVWPRRSSATPRSRQAQRDEPARLDAFAAPHRRAGRPRRGDGPARRAAGAGTAASRCRSWRWRNCCGRRSGWPPTARRRASPSRRSTTAPASAKEGSRAPAH